MHANASPVPSVHTSTFHSLLALHLCYVSLNDGYVYDLIFVFLYYCVIPLLCYFICCKCSWSLFFIARELTLMFLQLCIAQLKCHGIISHMFATVPFYLLFLILGILLAFLWIYSQPLYFVTCTFKGSGYMSVTHCAVRIKRWVRHFNDNGLSW